MEKIHNLIHQSNEWRFKRMILLDNKYYANIEDGIVVWKQLSPNKYLYQEIGKISFMDNLKTNFCVDQIFLFNKNGYQVFDTNNVLYYQSNKTNRAFNIYHNKKINVELNLVNDIITFKNEIISPDSKYLAITNYYLKQDS